MFTDVNVDNGNNDVSANANLGAWLGRYGYRDNRTMNQILRQLRRANRLKSNELIKSGAFKKGDPELRGEVYVNPLTDEIASGKYTVDDIYDRYTDDFKRYFVGLINPEYAYQKGLQIKIPNPLPIPSVTITQVSSFNFTTPDGYFWLSWNPNFACTQDAVKKFAFTHNQESLNATGSISTWYGTNNEGKDVKFHIDSLPDLDAARMRLVSAKMKITYRGSSDNLSGKLCSCATFQPMPNAIVRIDTSSDPQPKYPDTIYFYDADRKNPDGSAARWLRPTATILNNFAEYGFHRPGGPENIDNLRAQTVLNGLWSRSLPLSEFNRGLSCTYIPLDTECQTFNTPGTVQGSLLKKEISEEWDFKTQANLTARDHVCSPIIDLYGGKMGYMVVGDGLPNAAQGNAAIDVEFYYNYEILPTTRSASTMRNYAPSYVPPVSMFNDLVTELSTGDALIRPITTLTQTNLEGWGDFVNFLKNAGSQLKDKVLKPVATIGKGILKATLANTLAE